MKYFSIIKFTGVFLSFLGVGINIVERIYVTVFNKPIFVHFYLVKKKLPKKKKAFLVDNVSFYARLNKKEKEYFEHRLVHFFREYDFIERGDIELTPEIKVLIASSYVKLTFGMRRYITTTFDKIIIYPKSFYSLSTKKYHKGEFNPRFKTIAFSWEDFLLGEIIVNDNLNLGIHEFAHVLTFHGSKSKDVSAKIFYKVFVEIVSFMNDKSNVELIKKSNYFRDYAFTNKLEFVSVIMEHFFETPEDLQKKFPVLYKKIKIMLNYKYINL